MSRNKRDKYRIKSFSISEEAIEKLKEGAAFFGLKDSPFIEFLIIQNAESLDPIEKLTKSNERIKEMREELKEEELKNQEFANNLSKHQTWLKEKQNKKPEAISILVRKIQSREYEDAERTAKTWARILGISPVELLAEAMEQAQITKHL